MESLLTSDVQLKEVLAQAAKWIHEHEPESLAFAFYEERNGDGVRISIYERYAHCLAGDLSAVHINADRHNLDMLLKQPWTNTKARTTTRKSSKPWATRSCWRARPLY